VEGRHDESGMKVRLIRIVSAEEAPTEADGSDENNGHDHAHRACSAQPKVICSRAAWTSAGDFNTHQQHAPAPTTLESAFPTADLFHSGIESSVVISCRQNRPPNENLGCILAFFRLLHGGSARCDSQQNRSLCLGTVEAIMS
jgi:hypothetical protein